MVLRSLLLHPRGCTVLQNRLLCMHLGWTLCGHSLPRSTAVGCTVPKLYMSLTKLSLWKHHLNLTILHGSLWLQSELCQLDLGLPAQNAQQLAHNGPPSFSRHPCSAPTNLSCVFSLASPSTGIAVYAPPPNGKLYTSFVDPRSRTCTVRGISPHTPLPQPTQAGQPP